MTYAKAKQIFLKKQDQQVAFTKSGCGCGPKAWKKFVGSSIDYRKEFEKVPAILKLCFKQDDFIEVGARYCNRALLVELIENGWEHKKALKIAINACENLQHLKWND